MSVASTALDVAKFLRERKGIKEEQRRYEQEFPLKEGQIKQQMAIALQQAEREKARMAPGGVETRKILSAPYGIGTEEARPKVIPEGMGHKLERLQGSLAEKQVAGYETPEQIRAAKGFETPEQRRVAEQDWEKKMADLRHQYALEIAGLKGGAEEKAVPFDESGVFNIKYFFDTANEKYPGFTFFDLVDQGGILKARDEIRNIVVGRFGADPAKIQAIETALDMWINNLFEMSKNIPGEEKNRSFGEVMSKFGRFLITPIGEEPGMIKREISKIPKLEEEGPLPGLELNLPGAEQPIKTGSNYPGYQAALPEREKKERKIRDLFSGWKNKKRQTRGGLDQGIMTGD